METMHLNDEMGREVTFHVPSTCLDRAQIALAQTGQAHCAMMMERIQEAVMMLAGTMGRSYKNNPDELILDAVESLEDAFDANI